MNKYQQSWMHIWFSHSRNQKWNSLNIVDCVNGVAFKHGVYNTFWQYIITEIKNKTKFTKNTYIQLKQIGLVLKVNRNENKNILDYKTKIPGRGETESSNRVISPLLESKGGYLSQVSNPVALGSMCAPAYQYKIEYFYYVDRSHQGRRIQPKHYWKNVCYSKSTRKLCLNEAKHVVYTISAAQK